MKQETQDYQQRIAELEQTIEANKKEIETLRKQNSTNPIEKFQSERDIYTHLGVDPSKDSISIDGFDDGQINVLKAVIKKMRFCEAYNGRKKLTLDDKRHYNWYYRSSPGSGLVFHHSLCNDDHATLISASRLSFSSEKHLRHARENFPELDLNIIDL